MRGWFVHERGAGWRSRVERDGAGSLRTEAGEMVCKPGSVPLAGETAIHLGRRLLGSSSDQPGDPGGAPVPAARAEASPYLTLLQAEFAAFHPIGEPKFVMDSSLWH